MLPVTCGEQKEIDVFQYPNDIHDCDILIIIDLIEF